MGFKFYRERKKFTQDDVAAVLGTASATTPKRRAKRKLCCSYNPD